MTNQAAQTMPEFPKPQVMAGHHSMPTYYTSAQLRAYGQACYEAGLNAGRHPDALPDGTLSKSTAKRLAGASVSERARELEQAQCLAVSLWERNYKESSPDWKVDETLTGVLLQISNMVSGMSLRSNADDRLADLVVSLRDRAKWGRGGQFTSPHDSEGTSRLMDLAADVLSRLKPVRADGRDTLEVAQGLAASIWEQHYREDSPNWQPFDNVPGVLSQISNMVSGMTRTTQPPHQDRGDWLDAIDRAIHWMQGAGIIGDTIRLTEVREQIAALTEAKQQGPGEASDEDIAAWLERHDLDHAIRGTDARAAFEDAQTFHMTKEAPQVEAKRQTGEGDAS